MKVLIVDDQKDVVKGLMNGIQWDRLGFTHILSAYTLIKAKEIITLGEVDLLLCDVEIPPGNGLELLSLIEKQNLKTLSIVLSSHAEFSYAQIALRNGALDYLIQPVSYLDVEKAIIRAMQLKSVKYSEIQVGTVPQKGELIHNSNDNPVEFVKRYIEHNISSTVTRDDIAERVHLSPDYISRIFKRSTGITLNEYITKQKIEFAKQLLISTQAPISVIALRVGYTNFSYFTQLFKRETGYTPHEYRNMY